LRGIIFRNPSPRNNQPAANRRGRSASAGPGARNVELPRNNRENHRPQLYADEKHLLERLQIEQKVDLKVLHLSRTDQIIYNQNPHLREVFINNQQLQVNGGEFTSENRFITSSKNPLYKNKFDPEKWSTIEHWGQRKLLLTEIEFLTKYAADSTSLIIYAGAAPGSHINCLSSLFPRLLFVLIDSKDFSVTETDKVRVKRENFTSDLANYYSQSNHDILFICNVHTYNTNDNMQYNVIDDMENQLRWHQLLKPRAALLNFRLPHTSEKFRYFAGELLIEPWASKRATGCRLVVDKNAKIVDYNNATFEEAMVYFQNVTRTMYYKHNMDDINAEGLDHCYDCRAEIFILQQCLKKVYKINDEIDLKQQTAKLSAQISRLIQDKNRPKIIDTIRTLDIIPKK
jgi:trans-aconitate methyltransferase